MPSHTIFVFVIMPQINLAQLNLACHIQEIVDKLQSTYKYLWCTVNEQVENMVTIDPRVKALCAWLESAGYVLWR